MHLRLVTKIAMGYRGYDLPVSELVSEGNVGMVEVSCWLYQRFRSAPSTFFQASDPSWKGTGRFV
jgi:hypothetical protein